MSGHPTSLYVGNLPWHATEDDLARVFEQVAQVQSVRVIQDRKTGRSRGYGFVDLTSAEQVGAVLRARESYQLRGRPLILEPARARRGRTS